MLFLRIFGIVLGAILLLLFLFLFLPVTVLLSNDGESGFHFEIRLLWFSFKEKKKPKNHARPSKKKEPNRALLQALGFAPFADKETVKRTVKENGLSFLITETAISVRRLFEKIRFTVRHIAVKEFTLSCLCGGSDSADAAMDYGKTCAVLYPLLGFAEAAVRSVPKNTSLTVKCDFDRETSFYSYRIKLSLRVIYILWAVLTLVAFNMNRPSQKEASHEKP